MSQINDALKRAKDTPPKNMPSSMAPMMPVDALAAEHGANWIRPAAIILVLLLIASLFIAISSGTHAGPKIIAESETAPVPVVHIAPAPAPVPAPAAPAPMVLAANLPKPARIQGIVDDPVHPYAIVSGKTVYVGDQMDGQRVTAISPEAITLVGNGQTNQLHVGRH
jgi:hypothetical protein